MTTPSSSSSSSTRTRANFQEPQRTENIPFKCLAEIPLVPQPTINTSHLTDLESAKFVNIVFENEIDDVNKIMPREDFSVLPFFVWFLLLYVFLAFFRISDENNKDMCRIIGYRHQQSQEQLQRNGLKYLECRDMLGNCVLYVAYPIGLGEVAILTPSEELVGECQSNVEFFCLSVKVKYNFCDVSGKRLLKMTGIMAEEGSSDKFMLMVKRSRKEKLALVKMGSLNSCCQIKFKMEEISIVERLIVIALWSGFMHNELLHTNAPALLERHAEVKREHESRRKKSLITKVVNNVVGDDGESSNHPNTQQTPSSSTNDNEANCCDEVVSGKKNAVVNNGPSTITKVKIWKDLVTSHFSRWHPQHPRQYGSNNNVNDHRHRDQIIDSRKTKHSYKSTAPVNLQNNHIEQAK